MSKMCDCYVVDLDAEVQFSLHYGSHSLECPVYSPSLDPVDQYLDDLFRLHHEALAAGQFRGHTMTAFNADNQARCRECGAWVQVDPSPPPNGIDIGGPAVAIGCEEYERNAY